MTLIKPHLVLASSSPRRKELLSPFKLHLTISPSDIDESQFQWNMQNVEQSACHLALLKAQKTAEAFPNSTIIGVDTIVVHKGECLGKPRDKDEARQFLKRLSGETHKVISGCAVLNKAKHKFLADTTYVTFFPLRDSEIETYLETDIWQDKAGGYAIQGVYGALFVREIQGCFYNAMGFPLGKLSSLLEDFGILLWEALPHNTKT